MTKDIAKDKELAPKEAATPPAMISPPGRGFEEPTEKDDLIIPRATLLQPLSPQVADGIEGCKPGAVINSLSNEPLGEVFIPVFKFTEYLKFNPRSTDDPNFDAAYDPGALIWKVTDPSDPRTEECKFGEGGEKPTAQKVMNFLSYFPGASTPIVIGFSKTSYKAGKKLLSLAQFSGGDLFSRKYKLVVKHIKGEFNYFVLDVGLLGKANKDEFAVAEGMYKAFRGKELQVHEPAAEPTAGTEPELQPEP